MSKVISLFSGSKGNSFYISCNRTSVLIDAGVSAKSLCLRMEECGIIPEELSAIFITHEHSDHIKGLRVFADKYLIPVYGSKGTLDALDQFGLLPRKARVEVISRNGTDIGDVFVRSFSTPHDCREPKGYVCETSDGKRISVCTDLGYVSPVVKSSVAGSDFVLLESNHDINMLKNGAYPPALKKRILGMFGHLSNDACDELLVPLVESGTTRIMLGHISQDNNSVALALSSARKSLFSGGCKENEDYLIYAADVCGNDGFIAL